MDNSVFFEEETSFKGYSNAETLEINLGSCGKLSAPPTIKVTDYTMEDTLKISSATSSNIIEVLIEILQARVQDDFDVRLLHENEFEEILLSIYVNFWNRFLLDYPFPWTEEDLKDLPESEAKEIRSGERVLKTNIDLSQVSVNEISEDFKEPIVIDMEYMKVGIRLPRVGDFLLAEEKVKEKFAVKDKRFSDIRFLREQGVDISKEIDSDRLFPYLTYEKERATYFLALKQSLLLKFIEKDGSRKSLTTFEEKYHGYKHLPRQFWNILSKELSDMKFGVDHSVKMKNPLTNEIVTRRCLFQVLDFIPTDDISDSSRYTVQYGD